MMLDSGIKKKFLYAGVFPILRAALNTKRNLRLMERTTDMTEMLWQPTAAQIDSANITRFRKKVSEDWMTDIPDIATLWNWSVAEPGKFWRSVWQFTNVIGEGPGNPILVETGKMEEARFLPNAKLNFTENLLQFSSDPQKKTADAIVFWGEDKVKRRLTFGGLRDQVIRLARYFRSQNLQPGDRIAGFVPNMPEAVIGALAAASIGCIWSSCSPDFGVQGVLDRFGQIAPRLLLVADGYWLNTKPHRCLGRVAEFIRDLPSVERILVIPYLSDTPDLSSLPSAILYPDALAVSSGATDDFEFLRFPFNHPLFIMYSSGTTGVPKCIVHGAGGTLIQHLKEHQLHCDIKPGDRLFYTTTCGWMMWNWLISGLASGATIMLYDGAPFAPDGNILFDYAEAEGFTHFGTSAKYIDACSKAGAKPAETHNLSTLRMMTSTGSPLAPESFDYVYRNIKRDICLASISGGTDIISCFMLGNPAGPVWRGEIQMRGLGMAVEVWNAEGEPVIGEKGELVCTSPFPSMPVGFWQDEDNQRYRAAYFEHFPNIWRHGDYVELTEHGGIIVFGRSDAVLNPGGIRIGTAEIYRPVEQLEEVLESIVIGQEWQNDTRVILFVRLRDGIELDAKLVNRIRQKIMASATLNHMPAKILQVADIPRTKSGKIVELAVRDVIHGRQIRNREALANPEALDLFRNLPGLRS
ncbi:acetoacetate--CoA ligase [Dongia soli]|uniref:Acetoacetate--CoA ligase n=1 Tax=Dongia soli TaxID=600628 RepID=A0ABU5EDH8_9PROT|nr:acetoacetate--CoA ligase [Dongia soli]MDY0884261.1 acetoacetate--CoA ligase [Dongia soli]